MQSSNGFLRTLDLRTSSLPVPSWWRRLILARRVMRAVAQPAGDWTLFTADGRRHVGDLAGGWILADLDCCGLVWRTLSGQRLGAVILLSRQPPDTARRLLVRLRWPQCKKSREPVFPAG